jgi:hypothetical protein
MLLCLESKFGVFRWLVEESGVATILGRTCLILKQYSRPGTMLVYVAFNPKILVQLSRLGSFSPPIVFCVMSDKLEIDVL